MNQVVEITERAAERLKSLAEAGGGKVLRLSVKGSGCGGNKYDLNYQEEPGAHDEKVEAHGSVLFIDPKSLMFVFGTRVDWVEDGMSRSFTFENPNETSRCGCGESFSVR